MRFIDPDGMSVGDPPWKKNYSTQDNPIYYKLPVQQKVYVYDQQNKPNDKGVKGETYTAKVYIENGNKTSGPYKGSSYPNSKSNSDNSTAYNTITTGKHSFNNEAGHKGGTQKGLNIDDSKNGSRTTTGTGPNGNSVEMQYVNVHKGASDNGGYKSRGSAGCITISPSDFDGFISNFDWNSKIGNSRWRGFAT